MRLFTLFLLAFVLLSACSTKHKTTNYNLASSNDCQLNWQYLDLKQQVTGKILAYAPSMAFCGTEAFASSTVIQTSLNDTIRILTLCNLSKDFKILDKVEVAPAEKPKFGVGVISDEYACHIKRTYYGTVTKSK